MKNEKIGKLWIIMVLFVVLVLLIANYNKPEKKEVTANLYNISTQELFIYNTGVISYIINIKGIGEDQCTIAIGIAGEEKKEIKLIKGSPINILGLKIKLKEIYNNSALIYISGTGKIGRGINIETKHKYSLKFNETYILGLQEVSVKFKKNGNSTYLIVWPDTIREKKIDIDYKKSGLYRIETTTIDKELVIYVKIHNITNDTIEATFNIFNRGKRGILPFLEPVIKCTDQKRIALGRNGMAVIEKNSTIYGMSIMDFSRNQIIVEIYIYNENHSAWEPMGLVYIDNESSSPIDIGYRLEYVHDGIAILKKVG